MFGHKVNGSLKPKPAGISKIKYPLIISNKVVLSNYSKQEQSPGDQGGS